MAQAAIKVIVFQCSCGTMRPVARRAGSGP
jgi:hypothetical protein